VQHRSTQREIPARRSDDVALASDVHRAGHRVRPLRLSTDHCPVLGRSNAAPASVAHGGDSLL
jgi:hypothetical protein